MTFGLEIFNENGSRVFNSTFAASNVIDDLTFEANDSGSIVDSRYVGCQIMVTARHFAYNSGTLTQLGPLFHEVALNPETGRLSWRKAPTYIPTSWRPTFLYVPTRVLVIKGSTDAPLTPSSGFGFESRSGNGNLTLTDSNPVIVSLEERTVNLERYGPVNIAATAIGYRWEIDFIKEYNEEPLIAVSAEGFANSTYSVGVMFGGWKRASNGNIVGCVLFSSYIAGQAPSSNISYRVYGKIQSVVNPDFEDWGLQIISPSGQIVYSGAGRPLQAELAEHLTHQANAGISGYLIDDGIFKWGIVSGVGINLRYDNNNEYSDATALHVPPGGIYFKSSDAYDEAFDWPYKGPLFTFWESWDTGGWSPIRLGDFVGNHTINQFARIGFIRE